MEQKEENFVKLTKEQEQMQRLIYSYFGQENESNDDYRRLLSNAEFIELSENFKMFTVLLASKFIIQKEQEDRIEDLFARAEENYGENKYGIRAIMELLPKSRIDKIVEKWKDKLGENDRYIEVCHDVWDECLKEERWYNGLDNFSDEEFILYKAYLREWISLHKENEGEPYSIQEFKDEILSKEKLANYYQTIAEKEPEQVMERIIERAKAKNYLKNDTAKSLKILFLAYEHYSLDLEGLLNASEFEFSHDIIQIFEHYHEKDETFDKRFVPRNIKSKRK